MVMECKVTVRKSHYPKEVPFDVPKGWVWTTLDAIAKFSGGKTPSMDNKSNWDNGKHLWITSKDMKSEAICNSQIMLSDSGLQGMTIHQPGTILMVNRSGILRRTLPIGILQKEATINQDLKAITPFLFELTPFLLFCLKAFEPIILQDYKKAGTTVDNINFDHFVTIPIPLPPIQEQGRIVQSVQNWNNRIEDIEKASDQIQNAIEATKSKILELAIHGKLVAQDPSEESAIELLKRINPDFNASDNLHYEDGVKKGWIKCHVSDAFEINPKVVGLDDEECAFVPMALVPGGYSNELRFERKQWSEIKNGFTRFADGDIGVAKISPCLENRKSVIFQGLPSGKGAGTTELIILRPVLVTAEYGLLFLKSRDFIAKCKGTYNGVVGQQRVDMSVIRGMYMNIPPIPEQHRIVQAVNSLMHHLDIIQRSNEL